MTKQSVLKNSMLLLSVVALGIAGCSKSKNDGNSSGMTGEVTFTVNGDGFSNQVITIQGIRDSNHLAEASTYFKQENETTLDIGGGGKDSISKNWKFETFFAFKGNSTGTQYGGDSLIKSGFAFLPDVVQLRLNLYRNGVSRTYYYNTGVSLNPGNPIWTTQTPDTFNITKYEGVGGRIEGTFQGVLIEEDGIPEVPITITNGHFWIIRGPDNPL